MIVRKLVKKNFGRNVRSKSGRVILRPVDQTPVAECNKNSFGCYDNDITLLMRASDAGDKSLFEKLANRLSMINPEKDNSDKSIKQLFNEWKPLYLQTASELQAWPAYLKQFDEEIYKELYGDDEHPNQQPVEHQKQQPIDNSVVEIKSE